MSNEDKGKALRSVVFLDDRPDSIRSYIYAAERFGFESKVANSIFALNQSLGEQKNVDAIIVDLMLHDELDLDHLGRMNGGYHAIESILRNGLLPDRARICLLTEREETESVVEDTRALLGRYDVDPNRFSHFRKYNDYDHAEFTRWLERTALISLDSNALTNKPMRKRISDWLVGQNWGTFWGAVAAIAAVVAIVVAI